MYHFFVNTSDIADGRIRISGEDRFHAVNVLRLRKGEELLISDDEGRDYHCLIDSFDDEALYLSIKEELSGNHELPSEVWLFQGLPKAEKMELIIQKATELGVSHIVPMVTKNTVSRPDEKKMASKLKRWQAIALAAAKQSKRSMVPVIHEPLRFTEACEQCADMDVAVMAYEDERGMENLCEAIVNFVPERSIAVMIGPEGGFDPLELRLAKMKDILIVSLGDRILRTETAAIAPLSMVMIRLQISKALLTDTGEGD